MINTMVGEVLFMFVIDHKKNLHSMKLKKDKIYTKKYNVKSLVNKNIRKTAKCNVHQNFIISSKHSKLYYSGDYFYKVLE